MASKAISAERDRLQSTWLVAIMGTLLATFGGYFVILGTTILDFRASVIVAAFLSLTFGFLVWALRAATLGAALWGSLICLQVTMATGGSARLPFRSALFPLMMLFILTLIATRFGRLRKEQRGIAELRSGRTASQIFANLGLLGLLATGSWFGWPSYASDSLPTLLLAALCEANADTISSEIGQSFGGTPFLLTTLQRVDPGTDGAISFLGTITGISGAAIVAAAGLWAMRLSLMHAAVAFAGGMAGLFFDSLLGATIERRGWLNNDLVNFTSTVFAASVAWALLLLTY